MHVGYLEQLVKNLSLDLHDPNSRISIEQMKKGKVLIMSLPIFTDESQKNSSELAIIQSKLFKELPAKYPELAIIHSVQDILKARDEGKIGIITDIDNLTSIRNPNETFEQAIKNFETIIANVGGTIRSVTYAWKYENPFGGGNETNIGLKEDGKRFLDYLHSRNGKGPKIAVDLSHASPNLAIDTINYIEKKNLNVPLMAGHTRARNINNIPRYLSDEVIKKIIERKGIIGINLLRHYEKSNDPTRIAKHIEHIIKLGGENNVGIGSDFFNTLADVPPSMQALALNKYFFPEYGDASKFQDLLQLLRNQGIKEDQIKKIASDNYLNFLKTLWE
jgi:membrane dipeptidase